MRVDFLEVDCEIGMRLRKGLGRESEGWDEVVEGRERVKEMWWRGGV